MNQYLNTKQNIVPVEMFSKIGRYISKKNVRIPRNQSKQTTVSFTTKLELKQPKIKSNDSKIRIPKTTQFQPSVGHYKVKYSLIDKHLPYVNFRNSLPHFAKDKYFCYQNSIVQKDYPQNLKQTITGFNQLKRMTSRQDIKGCIRKVGQNPNEKRFQKSWDNQYWSNMKNKKTVNFNKMLKRNNILFKSLEFSPDYDINSDFNKNKLATHIIKFQKQLPRANQFLVQKTCLSQQFQQASIHQFNDKTVKFQKLLPRYNQQELPSYMDKSINSRMAISTRNWKTLKLNCSQIKQQK